MYRQNSKETGEKERKSTSRPNIKQSEKHKGPSLQTNLYRKPTSEPRTNILLVLDTGTYSQELMVFWTGIGNQHRRLPRPNISYWFLVPVPTAWTGTENRPNTNQDCDSLQFKTTLLMHLKYLHWYKHSYVKPYFRPWPCIIFKLYQWTKCKTSVNIVCMTQKQTELLWF